MAIRKRFIREQVEGILRDAGISAPPVDPVVIARNLGLEVQSHAAPNDGSDVSGCLIRKPGMRPIIGVNREQHENRQRFTVAHEIGHFLLHEGDEIHLSRAQTFRVNFRDSAAGAAIFTDEKEANFFAAELLMPAKMLAHDIDQCAVDLTADNDGTLDSLASRYKVSTQALTYRLINLGWIPGN